MVSYQYRHNPYVVNAYQFLIGGAGDLFEIDFVKDRKQGFGVPAKSIVVYNLGGAYGTDYLYVKYSSDNQRYSPELGLFSGQRLVVEPADGVMITNAMVWAESLGTAFTLVATPGIWTDQELSDLGFVPIPKVVPTV